MEKLNSTAECRSLIEKDKLSVIFFKAEWASEPCRRVQELLNDMREYEDFQSISFVEVEAEEVPDICVEQEVAYVPAVLFFRNGRRLDRIDGFNASTLTNKVKYYAANRATLDETVTIAPTHSSMVNGEQTMEQKLTALVKREDIMLFMKGDRDTPRCGFSNTIVQILKSTGLPFGTFDILGDEQVRQELKTFSNWQTYPQVYVKGELIGGLDIIKELQESGELEATLAGK